MRPAPREADCLHPHNANMPRRNALGGACCPGHQRQWYTRTCENGARRGVVTNFWCNVAPSDDQFLSRRVLGLVYKVRVLECLPRISRYSQHSMLLRLTQIFTLRLTVDGSKRGSYRAKTAMATDRVFVYDLEKQDVRAVPAKDIENTYCGRKTLFIDISPAER